MPIGRIWPSESFVYRDPVSGVPIRQLTNYKGHSHHFYFTNPGWYDNGRKMLFGSDRENRTNLFSLDLGTFQITQLTDLPTPAKDDLSFQAACLNPTRAEAYFWYERCLTAIDLSTLVLRTIWQCPDGFRAGMLSCTADGRFVCTSLTEDLSSRFTIDMAHGYVGFRETYEAHPLCRIQRIAVEGSGASVLWEDRAWLGHVNASLTQPHILTFCHEGPWELVGQRIWGLDMRGGEPWKIRTQKPGECAGHEYWFPDGLRIGYHGWTSDTAFYGCIRYDNTDPVEIRFPFHSEHYHSRELDLIVGDDDHRTRAPHLLIWRRRGDAFDGPRMLAQHRSSRNCQQVHVHPCFTPDGTSIVFTSDRSGYGNIYMVEVPEFESLPEKRL